MLTPIDWEKFHKVFSSYLRLERSVVPGSDEHLDLLLHIGDDLREMTRLTVMLANGIASDFFRFTEEMARDTLQDIWPCVRMSRIICRDIRRSPLLRSLAPEVDAFEEEVLGLSDVIGDMMHCHGGVSKN
ncbi:hypothetical protein [Chitinophaga caseinilytica]|uniref:hypothetical protein n=1 Tax=Chitinophaga caseinilytica TaxID=2267521 RepID=UPI003C2EFC7A